MEAKGMEVVSCIRRRMRRGYKVESMSENEKCFGYSKEQSREGQVWRRAMLQLGNRQR